MFFHPNGIGISNASDQLAGAKNLVTAGTVWYVDSVTGVDAAGRGRSPEYPVATFAQALSNSSSGDIVVLLPTHDEIVTAQTQIDKRLTIVGLGTTSGKPSAGFTNNVAGGIMFANGGAPVEWRNVFFKKNGAAATTYKIAAESYWRFHKCRFEAGDNDPKSSRSIMLIGASSDMVFSDCWFGSVATDPTDPPATMVDAIAFALTRVRFERCTFDAGLTGFSGTTGYALNLGGANVDLVLEDLTLNGADVNVGSTSTGRANVLVSTGAARVVW